MRKCNFLPLVLVVDFLANFVSTPSSLPFSDSPCTSIIQSLVATTVLVGDVGLAGALADSVLGPRVSTMITVCKPRYCQSLMESYAKVIHLLQEFHTDVLQI